MPIYPLRVRARLDAPLSRGLWLVKWLLAIPHYVVLWFLWVAYAVLTVVAFFAIVFTGRYPRSIFEFNVGVLRWTWRVAYYSYGALGTDRYPPFTLAEVPDYPATLTVEYPDRLSRGKALVKWWLLAIPHYLVVGVFAGGSYALTRDETVVFSTPGGLIGLLVLFAGIALLFTGRYPRGLFDLLLGLHRWALRVAAYASLMTDAYPPFRLDLGPDEPHGRPLDAAPPATGDDDDANPARPTPPPPPTGPAAPTAAVGPTRWTAGRVVSIIVGALLLVTGFGSAAGAAGLAWADQTQRDSTGYLSTPVLPAGTDGHAVRFDGVLIGGDDDAIGPGWLGTVRIHADATIEKAVFIGIARTGDVDRYLGRDDMARTPATAPAAQGFWVASATGRGEQTVTWDPPAGSWTVVVMNADASTGVDVDVRAGATMPGLDELWLGLLIGGAVALVGGAGALVYGARGARS